MLFLFPYLNYTICFYIQQTLVLYFTKKLAHLTHHYYNILMGNPLTSSKDLSVLGAGLKTSVKNEFDIVYGGFCFIPSLSLYQTLG